MSSPSIGTPSGPPTFDFSNEWRGPFGTLRPTPAIVVFNPASSVPSLGGFLPVANPSVSFVTNSPSPLVGPPPSGVFVRRSGDSRGNANQLYGGAECWVWILVAAILGVVVGYLLSLLCNFWTRRRVKTTEEKGTTNGALLRDPLRELPAHISDTMVSHVEMGRGSTTVQPAVFFPGQSLRSETRVSGYPHFQHQPSESVLISNPATLRDDVEEKKQQQLEREKVHQELERGMTLEGTSYQYFHPDDHITDSRNAGNGVVGADDDSPRVSFTFSTH